MKAKLILKTKQIDPEGFILEMVIWQLPEKTEERPHGIKYRLYYGDHSGKCLVRYDNEQGKGDHKHLGAREEEYVFQSAEKLVKDFFVDIDELTEEGEIYERA